MGQKINPVSLRLQYTNRYFDSCWYSNYFYRNLITRDIFLQYYFNNFLKLLKIASGRYSIQHLQKNTQIYNFLCYSKSTREWRSKIFGLAKRKNFSKKARYFFKTTPRFKKKLKKNVKLKSFYSHLNQLAVHRIKKKITSFQNLLLWSRLVKTKPLFTGVKSQFNSFFLFPVENLIKNTVTAKTLFKNLNTDLYFFPEKKGGKSLLLEKMNSLSVSKKKSIKELKANTPSLSLFRLEKPMSNSNLRFLQNLFVYQILKSKLNNNINQSNFNGLKYTNHLEFSLASLYKTEMNLINFKVKNDWQNASYLADEIVYFLEKRISFRALKSKILKQLAKIPQIRGLRITCSGRVGGKSKKAQRAKTECIKYGQTSLQVFSSKIDFAVKTAFTSFGSVGVKVWICYN